MNADRNINDYRPGELMTMTSEQAASITVESIKKSRGVHTVQWRDNGRKRRILVHIADWSTADWAVATAVRAQYPDGAQPAVSVPLSAWR